MPLLQLNLSGRLGNLCFQAAYAKAWCIQNNYDLCMLPWIGEIVFEGFPPAIRPDKCKPDIVWTDRLFQHQRDLIYTRKQVKEWFAFKPEILEMLQPAKCPRHVCLNIRQGQDYRDAGLVTLSKQCYVDAAKQRGYGVDDICFEIDTQFFTLSNFQGNVKAGGFGVCEVVLPSFYRLMTAPVLFRANSTFSYWAHVLSDNQNIYAPLIRDLKGGILDTYCPEFVNANWPAMVNSPDHSDLHLLDEPISNRPSWSARYNHF